MSKILEELDKRIDEYIEKEDFSGVIRVTIKDKIVYEKRADFLIMLRLRGFMTSTQKAE